MNLSRHIETFTAFAAQHLTGDQKNDYLIQLKIDHSLRVLDNARAILDGENITGHSACLTRLAALYHDIGRFPQYARYGTYKDADSTNHGRLGVLTLRELDLPGKLTDRDWRTIRAAVALHNVKDIRSGLSDPLSTMLNTVRDADKIDIYEVILDHLGENSETKPVLIHSLENNPDRYSETVYNMVFSEKTCDYNLMRYTNDFILLITGWIFTLNFTASVHLFVQKNLVERAFSILPKNDKIQSLENKVLKFMHYKTLSTP
jgi:putative nucleotidyltransferase with HDIG domain